MEGTFFIRIRTGGKLKTNNSNILRSKNLNFTQIRLARMIRIENKPKELIGNCFLIKKCGIESNESMISFLRISTNKNKRSII
jgi:hypothetical protein